MAEAVTSNERIFVFIRDTVGVLSEHDLAFVKELKVKPTDANEPVKGPGEVSLSLSSLLSRLGTMGGEKPHLIMKIEWI